MKIGFIMDGDIYSGIGRQNYTVFKGLKEKGMDIDLISLSIYQKYIFPKRFFRSLEKKGYTHIILGLQCLAYLYPSLSKLNLKTSIIIHDLCLVYKKNKNIFEFINEKLLIMKDLYKFNNLIFISNFAKNDYINHVGELNNKNYKVIYQGIDKKEINDITKHHLAKKYNLQNKTIFLNVGSEDSRKNIKTYLEIAEKYKNNKDILFVRVGKKSKESDLFINKHKINNVLYLSGLSDEELFALYNLSKSIISTSLFEGYGRQIFEGYLYGNYVITSDVSDVKEILDGDDSVYIINDPFDVEGYCKAINKILTTNKLQHKTKAIPNTMTETEGYYKFLTSI